MQMRLPIEEVQEQVTEWTLGGEQRLLLCAPTGSGKSVRVPQMLLDAGIEGLIVVVEPRRMAARMLARFVSGLLGGSRGRVGGEVGYVVRFDRCMGSQTRIVYVTDGVFQRWLEDENALKGVGAVVFDEFHERRVSMDWGLAESLRLQQNRGLKVVVMSATLEVGALQEYLHPCVELVAEGRTFPVEITYQKVAKTARGVQRKESIWQKAARAVLEALACEDSTAAGDVLVFMPGWYEIQRTVSELLAKLGNDWEVLELHGKLSSAAQDRVLMESSKRRVIVSTNIAETSLTLPKVTLVVDSGLARRSGYDPVRQVNTLMVEPISQAAAQQRAGRAGRVAEGKCVRLWSEREQAGREAFELAEIHRTELSGLMLRLGNVVGSAWREYPWFERPEESHVEQAVQRLRDFGAWDAQGITELGEELLRMGLEPRGGRFLLAARELGCLSAGIFVAAVLEMGNSVRLSASKDGMEREGDESDFLAEWRAFEGARNMGFVLARCQQIQVHAGRAKELEQHMVQLSRRLQVLGWESDDAMCWEGLNEALLLAYSGQVAVRKSEANRACAMVGGRKGILAAESVVKQAECFVVTEITEVAGKDVQVHFRACAAVNAAMLEKHFPEKFNEEVVTMYDESMRRVVGKRRRVFEDLVLAESNVAEVDRELAASLLAQRVASGKLRLKRWDEEVEQWIARLLCLREWMPELELPSFGEEDRALALESVCQGALGYKEIQSREVMPALGEWLSAAQHGALEAYAPKQIELSNASRGKLKYEVGKPPVLKIVVQRLFGVEKTPTIADGRVKVELHLCAPNHRPWQITQDLEGFWESGLEQMRKDLAGRYPKHRWEK